MRRFECAGLLVGLSFFGAGCRGPFTLPNGAAANVPQQLVLALAAHDQVAAQSLLKTDVALTTSAGTVHGSQPVGAALRALEVTEVPEGHHDVARVTLGDGRLLFVSAQADKVAALALFPHEANAERSVQLQHYQDAWNLLDAGQRKATLQTAWAEAGRYLDPGNDARGIEGLDDTIVGFQRSFPGARLSSPVAVVALPDGWVAADWVLEAPDSPDVHGFDVAHATAEGPLDLVSGFFTAR